MNCNINDLASTLLFVAIKKGLYIIGHIGDGVIGYLKKEELKVASEPKNGEFINTTVFTTSINVMDSMKIIKGSINDIEGFVLMSDGSENSLYQKAEKKISNSIKKIMNLLILIPKNELENMLVKTFESIICQATIDDCSIVFLVKDLDLFKGYRNLTESEKCKLLNLNINYDRKFNYIRVRKRLKRFDTILNFMIQEKDLKEISKHIHLKPKYTQKKYIDKLLMLNFIKISNSKYKTLIFLEKE
ncbi:protein phosphatase 2C domain-containing protein [Treponema putidum]|uniref:protein phosphatase 2C domain-containing protein n=1 Tax=Treponema putidum TaxID=221027 RepID=UPI000AAC94AA|nr:protein phosphatase 2C domain-containing protein [Treponema putidum]